MQNRILSWALLIGLIALTPSVYANASPSPFPTTGVEKPELVGLDNKIIKLMKVWHIPGAALAIAKNGHIVYARGYGYADVEKQTLVQPTSLFRIASVSKAITAVSILKLVADQKISLDEPVFDILNDLPTPNGRTKNPNIYKITIQDLLQMSSGWLSRSAGRFDPLFGPWPYTIKNILGRENLPPDCSSIVSTMMTFPLRFKPGSQFAYSNLDYCTLGLIIDKVAHGPYNYATYENFVKKEILAPIGIHDMHIGSTDETIQDPNEVHYYRYPGQISAAEEDLPVYLPYGNNHLLQKNYSNGGWVASATDLAKFAYAVSHYYILPKPMVAIMLAKPAYLKKEPKKYCTMGWRSQVLNNHRYWYGTGSFTGTNALVINRPDGASIAVVFNSRPPPYSLFYEIRPRLLQTFASVAVE